jgi:hypothetical protein
MHEKGLSPDEDTEENNEGNVSKEGNNGHDSTSKSP